MINTADSYEVLRMPSLLDNGFEVVETRAMAMSQRFLSCLNNERMTDVSLVGDDGIEVPACKFILGSASTNLQTLLYNGKETKSIVRIDNCRSKALQALVEFSCSDVLNTNIWSDTEPVEIVEDMVSLAKMAEMYTLPNLKQQVADVLCPCLDQLPSLACVAYNLVDKKTTPELHDASLSVLRKKPYEAFVKGPGGEIGGIACLGPDKLTVIFCDQEVNAEEIFLFQCLLEWKAANTGVYSNTNQICKKVAQLLDYSSMHASDIENIVLPSGMVDSTSLVNGLMTLAKAAEKKGVHLRSARSIHASKNAKLDVSMNRPGSKSSRNRRFKKPEHTLSGDSSVVSNNIETRDESLSNHVPGVQTEVSPASQAPAAPHSPSKKSKITNSFRTRKVQAQALRTRATRFLGSLRTKSDVLEMKSMDETVNIPPPKSPKAKKEKIVKKKVEAKMKKKGLIPIYQAEEDKREVVSACSSEDSHGYESQVHEGESVAAE